MTDKVEVETKCGGSNRPIIECVIHQDLFNVMGGGAPLAPGASMAIPVEGAAVSTIFLPDTGSGLAGIGPGCN
jgi:hypothetical protein